MVVEFDVSKSQTIRAKDGDGRWWRLNGKCLRCGKCCTIGTTECKQLEYERIDGVMLAKCKVQFFKPFSCFIYPDDPTRPLEDGCGFSWEIE